jgi:hypothetical protein
MMLGLFHGIKDHAWKASNAAKQVAQGLGGAFGGGPGGGAPSANAALARHMFPAWGSGAEWAAWNALAMQESGWSSTIQNASSGALGIAQALGHGVAGGGGSLGNEYGGYGLTLAGARAANSGNAAAQIDWMANYIRTTPGYGDPIRAEQHELAYHWYGGGFHGWFDRPTVIGVGDRGGERVDITPGGGGRGGGDVVFQPGSIVIQAPAGNGTQIGQQLVEYINEALRRGAKLHGGSRYFP